MLALFILSLIASLFALVLVVKLAGVYNHDRNFMRNLLRQEQERVDELRRDAKAAQVRLDYCDDKITQHGEALKKHDEASGGFWRQKNGTLMRIRDMSDNHLKNSIRLLAGQFHGTKDPRYSQLWKEHERRAEDQQWRKRTEGVVKVESPTAQRLRLAAWQGSVAIASIRKAMKTHGAGARRTTVLRQVTALENILRECLEVQAPKA